MTPKKMQERLSSIVSDVGLIYTARRDAVETSKHELDCIEWGMHDQ